VAAAAAAAPIRDSKLTSLLFATTSGALETDGSGPRVTLVATVGDGAAQYDETIRTLRWVGMYAGPPLLLCLRL